MTMRRFLNRNSTNQEGIPGSIQRTKWKRPPKIFYPTWLSSRIEKVIVFFIKTTVKRTYPYETGSARSTKEISIKEKDTPLGSGKITKKQSVGEKSNNKSKFTFYTKIGRKLRALD